LGGAAANAAPTAARRAAKTRNGPSIRSLKTAPVIGDEGPGSAEVEIVEVGDDENGSVGLNAGAAVLAGGSAWQRTQGLVIPSEEENRDDWTYE
jgi:hypothetical protein